MKKAFLILGVFSFFSLFSNGIQILPIEYSRQADYVTLHIAIPEKGGVYSRQPIGIEVRLSGYSLGTITNLPRAKDISAKKATQSLHVILDDQPYFSYEGLAVDPLEEEDADESEELYQFDLPSNLKEGLHILRIFPARSFGEALHQEKNFAMTYFYVNKKTSSPTFLNNPFLTYNEPSGTFTLEKDKPVLLDFFVHNCQLSQDGFKIDLMIDGSIKNQLFEERPYLIFGLSKGTHTIEMKLLDSSGKFVEGPFNSIKRTFVLN